MMAYHQRGDIRLSFGINFCTARLNDECTMDNELPPLECDVLVIGSGAGGLAAAVTAAKLGLSVIVAEKEPQFGGTTAWSEGWLWVPRNQLAIAAGIDEPISEARRYLQHELGDFFNPTLIDTYLARAPEMFEFFTENSSVKFIDGNAIPDMHGRSPGASSGGRMVGTAPFDGTQLGEHLQFLKPPLKESTIWGMGVASGSDIFHFYHATKSWTSLKYVAKRLFKHFAQRVADGRSTHLVNGNALAARLAKSAIELGVDIRVSHPVQALLRENARVTGASVISGGGNFEIRARCGVVMATGGFPHDKARKRELLNHTHTGEAHWSAAAPGCTGDGLNMAEELGAEVIAERGAAALAPVSLVPRGDGTFTHFAHLFERGKPGLIAVNRSGKRFTNEADSHFDFMRNLLATGLTESWLICDHRFIRRWGLGAVKPWPMPFQIGHYVHNGYLLRASNLHALAEEAVIDPASLISTVERYNQMALSGVDEEFHKGETPYNKMQGDSGHLPNACMAPIMQAPFYAMKLLPGSLGTLAGLHTNEHAQVLKQDDQPIEGLYATGSDMASIMGGYNPSGGIALGPAMTFGYIAAKHIADHTASATITKSP
jgi:succinate dehydrogenase/fumarate reductase flavoprotein subunit